MSAPIVSPISSTDLPLAINSETADKLFYQTLEDLVEVTSINGEQSWDTSCFNGEYVTGDVTQDYLDDLEAARNDSAKSINIEPEGTIELHNDE